MLAWPLRAASADAIPSRRSQPGRMASTPAVPPASGLVAASVPPASRAEEKPRSAGSAESASVATIVMQPTRARKRGARTRLRGLGRRRLAPPLMRHRLASPAGRTAPLAGKHNLTPCWSSDEDPALDEGWQRLPAQAVGRATTHRPPHGERAPRAWYQTCLAVKATHRHVSRGRALCRDLSRQCSSTFLARDRLAVEHSGEDPFESLQPSTPCRSPSPLACSFSLAVVERVFLRRSPGALKLGSSPKSLQAHDFRALPARPSSSDSTCRSCSHVMADPTRHSGGVDDGEPSVRRRREAEANRACDLASQASDVGP